MPDTSTYYVLDNHRKILCTCTECEASLEIMAGMPEGYTIVDDNDQVVTQAFSGAIEKTKH